jgi:hypothetical protein
MAQLALHAELAICEVLSDGKPRSRYELAKDAKLLYWQVGWIPGAFTDALASLVAKNVVSINRRQFRRKNTEIRGQRNSNAAPVDDTET